MKVRESGMPAEEDQWIKFFDPDLILRQMEITSEIHSAADLGCGFGTFSVPASKIIKGKVYSFDIDEDMISLLQHKTVQMKIDNLELYLRDFIAEGTGLKDGSMDYVMLFNILHHENPFLILEEVYRILKPGGKAGIIHWRSDIPTPRGPRLEIRPNLNNVKNGPRKKVLIFRRS